MPKYEQKSTCYPFYEYIAVISWKLLQLMCGSVEYIFSTDKKIAYTREN